ncbi:MAG: hypothetical protein JKY61_12810 [Planctomycetes bacterium]|nr:hypothetical protein [Planctomycetota bacterium]
MAVTIRLDEVLIGRLDALLAALQADDEFRIYYPKKLKRTDAIRHALILGLKIEEARFAEQRNLDETGSE